MKKIFLILILPVLFVVGSCRKDLSSLNTDTISPPEGTVPAGSLFSQGLKAVVDEVTTSDVNENIFRLIAQYWTETTYTDESNYDLGGRDIPANWWRRFYKFGLINLEESRKYVNIQTTDANVKKNQLAMIDIVEVYTYATLVNTFGNIPYTEALKINNLFPKYDDAKTVYYDLLTRLDADIAALTPSAAGFGNADLLYGDDIVLWKKFANSLKLRMGITIADSDPAKAKSVVESAATGVFTSNDDNAVFHYLGATPNNNPVWGDQVNSGRADFMATTTIINTMLSLNDPRLDAYFATASTGTHIGGTPGGGGSFGGHSHPSVSNVYAPDAPSTLISYSEVEFILAEAVQRGFAVGGTAVGHYNNAVIASIIEWGGTAADAATYLAQPAVAYATATGTYQQKIGTQKWLALYNRGFDAYVELRRLDFPKLPDPAVPVSDFPVRFTYPTSEQNLNAPNWVKAASDVGGDEVTTKLFWDKF
jgi:Starch-binding associating with outer membrane